MGDMVINACRTMGAYHVQGNFILRVDLASGMLDMPNYKVPDELEEPGELVGDP